MKSKKSKKGTKKRNHTRIPTPPPPIYAEEEMPENAAVSGSENEDTNEKDDKNKKGANKKKAATYTKKDTHDIFANKDEDESGLHDVDLNTPLGDEERFPQSQTYLTPEQVRENEVARLKAERKEQRAAAKAKSKKSGSGEKVKHDKH
jgi:AP-3 complex subunit delta-1